MNTPVRKKVKDFLVCHGGQYPAEYIADKLDLELREVQEIFHDFICDKASNVRLIGYDKDSRIIQWRADWDVLTYLHGHRQDEDMAGAIEGIHGPQDEWL